MGVEKHFDGLDNCGRPSASTFLSFSISGSFTARPRKEVIVFLIIHELQLNFRSI